MKFSGGIFLRASLPVVPLTASDVVWEALAC